MYWLLGGLCGEGFYDLIAAYADVVTDWKLVIAGGSAEDNYQRVEGNKEKNYHMMTVL